MILHSPTGSLFQRYPLYSVDASAMYWLTLHMPSDVAPSLWALVAEWADEGRLLISDEIKRETETLDEWKDFFRERPRMVVSLAEMGEYFKAFQNEATVHNIQLTRPNSTRDQGDPFVVALALMLEKRSLANLRDRTDPEAICRVVTYENKGPGRKKIPDACQFYDIRYMRWAQVLKEEGRSI